MTAAPTLDRGDPRPRPVAQTSRTAPESKAQTPLRRRPVTALQPLGLEFVGWQALTIEVDNHGLEPQLISGQDLRDRLCVAGDQRPDTIEVERTKLDLVVNREDLRGLDVARRPQLAVAAEQQQSKGQAESRRVLIRLTPDSVQASMTRDKRGKPCSARSRVGSSWLLVKRRDRGRAGQAQPAVDAVAAEARGRRSRAPARCCLASRRSRPGACAVVRFRRLSRILVKARFSG
ncbi:hypothetical protein ENSA7_14010 [Enhygromyxa salina]|uniref:Uncharacterized protein n=1 Tax=Enhygromyxa salina TaxID=215803 RepID=A0A2S9YUQ0_9BACT|nr:hypothetical protein ENSA7_14010 [Enhygromyxa salina]